ncbi:MAG: DUF3786 domain-containing protein [Desulfobacterales bacterium]|nr:DUF3786 domain-containing protein [Desulfobacterales bacterium]
MPDKAAVFEETYRNYLARIADLDLLSRAAVLGAGTDGDDLIIHLYGVPYRLNREGVFKPSGETVNYAVCVVLCCYVLQCPDSAPPSGDWVTYREFKDAGPLVSYFTANTNKIIETAFAGNLAGLEEACRGLAGRRFDDGSSHDLSMIFDFLPRIPVLLRFNDRDEEFPAQCSVLFRQSTEAFLDMECTAIGGTFLAGHLTRHLTAS